MYIFHVVMDFFEDDQTSEVLADNINIIPPSQHSWEVGYCLIERASCAYVHVCIHMCGLDFQTFFIPPLMDRSPPVTFDLLYRKERKEKGSKVTKAIDHRRRESYIWK